MVKRKDNLTKICKYSGITLISSLFASWVFLFISMYLESSIIYLLASLFHYVFVLAIIVLVICGIILIYQKIKNRKK